MFSYTGLNEAQCLHLINHHHVHMMKNGRIAMVGLNSKNVNYVAEAVNDAVRNIKWNMIRFVFANDSIFLIKHPFLYNW